MAPLTIVHKDLKLWIHLLLSLGLFGWGFSEVDSFWGDFSVHGEMMLPGLSSSGSTVGTGWSWLWSRREGVPARETCRVLQRHRNKQLEEGDTVLPWPLHVGGNRGFPSCRSPLHKSSHNKASRPTFGDLEITWNPRPQEWGEGEHWFK